MGRWRSAVPPALQYIPPLKAECFFGITIPENLAILSKMLYNRYR